MVVLHTLLRAMLLCEALFCPRYLPQNVKLMPAEYLKLFWLPV